MATVSSAAVNLKAPVTFLYNMFCRTEHTCYLFELEFVPNIFPGVGLLDRMVAVFLIF